MAQKITPLHYATYFFERILAACCMQCGRLLPMKYTYASASLLGTAVSPLIHPLRRRVLGNLNLAFGSDKGIEEKLVIYRDANINFLKVALELLYAANMTVQKTLVNSITIVGQENLDNALRKGNGVLAVSGHFGNFGLIGLKMQYAGYCFHTVARAFRDPLRKQMYEKYRMQHGQSFIYTRTATEASKKILPALRKNEIVFLITDENTRHGGVFVDFFGRPASTNPGAAILHLRTRADLIPMFLLRNNDNTHKLVIEPPLEVSYKGSYREDVEAVTRLVAQKVEEYVRTYPSQWMWNQRRWRTRPPEEKASGIDPVYRKY